ADLIAYFKAATKF
nr:Chain E, artificial peptide [synthetic construct]1R5W_F Chain F, artificial peptide [synthetic construct]